MKPNEIRSALVLKGITVTSIATSIDEFQSNVSAVIGGHRKTAHIREAIAKAIGQPVDVVFPPEDQPAKEAA